MSLLVSKNTLQTQYNIASYLSQCHELWEQAELFLNKGNCEGLLLYKYVYNIYFNISFGAVIYFLYIWGNF